MWDIAYALAQESFSPIRIPKPFFADKCRFRAKGW